MTIVVTGGGSGGHITPILAVASELKRLQPDLRIVYIGQKGDKLADIPAGHRAIDAVHVVSAGKFRRYAGEGWKQIFDVKTQALNIRDGFRTLAGIWQSFWLMRKIRPAVIFSRGGFVSVPVCLGGRLRRVPYITHDSDTVPSLANRIIAKWASVHAVALPKEIYPYPEAKTVTVGIPLGDTYQLVTPTLQKQYKHELQLKPEAMVLLVTGGGNGAEQLNKVMIANSRVLLKSFPDLTILHITGRASIEPMQAAYDTLLPGEERKRVHAEGFVTDLYRYSGAADVIIARAGATNLAEFAMQGKACIIIPASQLVGGHQVKNAKEMAERGAIIVLNEQQAEQEERLAHIVGKLLSDRTEREKLSRALTAYAQPEAAKKTAELILQVAARGKGV